MEGKGKRIKDGGKEDWKKMKDEGRGGVEG